MSFVDAMKKTTQAAGGQWFPTPASAVEDEEERRKRLLMEQATKSGTFGDQGEDSWRQMNREAAGLRYRLTQQALGKDSLAQEQLRQGLQQNMAAQQAMAASANPNNMGMAARTAAMNMGRQGMGMSGQAAMAGIQERNQANNALGQLLMNQRGQDVQGVLGSRGNAIQGYSQGAMGQPEKSWFEKYGPMIIGGLGALGGGGKE